MTVPTLDFEHTFFADGSTVNFDFTFRVITQESVTVVNITTATTLTLGTDYTVVLNNNGVGGTVTLNDPQDDGDELHVYRNEDYFQELDLITQQDLKAEVIETALDKLCIQVQQCLGTNRFILDTVIPGLEALINSILNLSGTVLKTGTPAVGSIPLWSDDDPATLSSGLEPGADDTIIKAQGGVWTVSTGIPVLDLGTVVVPGTTDQNGIPYWDATDGTALGTIPPGDDGEVFAGNGTGGVPSFQNFLTFLGNLTSVAGQFIQLNGTGNPATVEDLPAQAPLAPSFFGPTSRPTGLKYWGLASPGAYAVGTRRPATVSGAQTNTSDSEGALLTLTTLATINRDVSVYTLSDDIAATRNALPIWITRIKTGASVAAIRIWAGLNYNQRNAMKASGAPTDSTAAFRYDTSVDGTAFWRCVTADGSSTATTTTTTVAVATGTSYILAIDMSESGHVKFLIDGVEVADHTTNLPEATDELDLMIICRTLAAAAKSISIGPVNLSHR